MLTLAEAALRLGITPDTLRQQIRNGALKARKVGPIWTVSEREVERYARENRKVKCYRCGQIGDLQPYYIGGPTILLHTACAKWYPKAKPVTPPVP